MADDGGPGVDGDQHVNIATIIITIIIIIIITIIIIPRACFPSPTSPEVLCENTSRNASRRRKMADPVLTRC